MKAAVTEEGQYVIGGSPSRSLILQESRRESLLRKQEVEVMDEPCSNPPAGVVMNPPHHSSPSLSEGLC